jgi:3-dehydroquinate dehydratase II
LAAASGADHGRDRVFSASRIAKRGGGGLETPAAVAHLKPMPRQVLILNGPNLNLLGRREPDVYGRATLADIETMCREEGSRLGLAVEFRQSNSEGQLVTWIQEIPGRFAGLVLNAGAYSHTSISLLDALRALDEPLIEVHLSNIYRRETFRQHSYVSLAAKGVICGFGPQGYVMALRALPAMWDDAQ